MNLYNLKLKNESISFFQAIKKGLGTNQGLYFPNILPQLNIDKIRKILKKNFIEKSTDILQSYLHNEIKTEKIYDIVAKSFSFPISVKKIKNNIFVLELFHGPTLAFKDFGSRFMANILSFIKKSDEKIVILTATSGDTGAAVAHSFYKMKNISVVILYPKNKISNLQEKLFCTLGENIHTIKIDGDFDKCQLMVKQAFQDEQINKKINLNSANSINISRLLAQICPYFEGLSQMPKECLNNLVVSVPSGNFGNLTAGLLAKSLGLPIKRFIAATNINDTVPRFLSTGKWIAKKTISTISNAMDVSNPNNWPRIEEICAVKKWNINNILSAVSICEKDTKYAMQDLYKKYSYIADPHTAIAYKALKNKIKKNECGLFISTAHPSKFKETLELVLNNYKIILPKKLSKFSKLKILSHNMKSDFLYLKKFLLNL